MPEMTRYILRSVGASMSNMDENDSRIADDEVVATGRKRFWNAHLAFVCLGIGALACVAAAALYPRLPSYALAVFGVYVLQCALVHYLGVTVRDAYVSSPLALTKRAPALTIGRTRIPLALLKDITALGAHLGYECVGLTSVDGQIPVLFETRDARLEFFKRVQAAKPDIAIYRAYR